MEVEIVKFFQNLANSFFDIFFWLITKMGEETFFLFVFAGIYLCYDKFFAVKYTFYYLMSVGVNTLVKGIVKRTRPYVASTEIENRLPASNYSFPSGHSQGYFVQATTGMIEINNKCNKKRFKIFVFCGLIIAGILVMISRMYWGQHYLTDVIVGMMFGISIPFVLDFIFSKIPKSFKDKFTQDRIFLIIGVLSMIVSLVCFMLEFGIGFYSRKVYKFSAILLAMSLGYFLDAKYIKFEPKQGWVWGIFKFLIVVVVLGGLYYLMTLFIPLKGFFYFVIYFVLGIVGTVALPAIFKVISIKSKK